jgi:hypothetical protein
MTLKQIYLKLMILSLSRGFAKRFSCVYMHECLVQVHPSHLIPLFFVFQSFLYKLLTRSFIIMRFSTCFASVLAMSPLLSFAMPISSKEEDALMFEKLHRPPVEYQTEVWRRSPTVPDHADVVPN